MPSSVRVPSSAVTPSRNHRRAASSSSATPSRKSATPSASSAPLSLSTADIVAKATVGIKGLSLTNAMRIWKAFGAYVATQVQRSKAIKIDQWGIFGVNEALEPVLLHHAVFLQSNRLKEPRQQAIASRCDPFLKVQWHDIAQELPQCKKQMIAHVITHVIAYVGKVAKMGKVIRLSFLPMGDWICDGECVKFAFLPEFTASIGVLQDEKPAEESKKPNETQKMAWTEDQQQQAMEKPTNHDILTRVKDKIKRRCGPSGLNALVRVLSLMDTSGDGELSAKELKFGLRDLGIDVSASEMQRLMQYFDQNRSGTISINEFLHGLRNHETKLPSKRLVLVRKAFQLMDPDGTKAISLDDVRENYDVSFFPDVRAGKKSKQQALLEFLREWETTIDRSSNQSSSRISWDAFVEYYHNISACVDDDSDFELLMRNTWHVLPDDDKKKKKEKIFQNLQVLIVEEEEEEEEQQQPEELGDFAAPPTIESEEKEDRDWHKLRTLLLTPPPSTSHRPVTLDDMTRLLGANRVMGDGNETMNTRAFAHALMQLDRKLQMKDAMALAQYAGTDDGAISLVQLYQTLSSSSSSSSQRRNNQSGQSGRQDVLERVRVRLLQRINNSCSDIKHVGLNGLQRQLKLMDTNRDQRLTKDELKVGLRKFGVDINFHELDFLFSVLDADHSGCISTEEFLIGMRGPMNDRRLALVSQAFGILDRDGDGIVTQQELLKVYDPSQHPDVLAGRMTPAEVMKLFAAQWETDAATRDGMITKQEFETYYRNLSASIDADDYFELMIRNAWHLSGGKGVCENTSNRRVLVTHKDGSQQVVELKNDLGIRAQDREKIYAKLRESGIESQDVALTGAVDHTQPAKKLITKPAPRYVRSTAWRRSERPPGTPDSQHSHQSHRSHQSHHSARVPPGGFGQGVFFEATNDDVLEQQKQARDAARERRQRAAELIQAHFRGHKTRKFVNCVRRKMAAEEKRKTAWQQDQQQRTKKITRPALKAYHGF